MATLWESFSFAHSPFLVAYKLDQDCQLTIRQHITIKR